MVKQQWKYERREKKYKKRRKMIVDGKSVFVIERVVNDRSKRNGKDV